MGRAGSFTSPPQGEPVGRPGRKAVGELGRSESGLQREPELKLGRDSLRRRSIPRRKSWPRMGLVAGPFANFGGPGEWALARLVPVPARALAGVESRKTWLGLARSGSMACRGARGGVDMPHRGLGSPRTLGGFEPPDPACPWKVRARLAHLAGGLLDRPRLPRELRRKPSTLPGVRAEPART